MLDGKAHPHSFVRDGEDKRTVEARIERTFKADGDKAVNFSIRSGMQGLTVLKSTGSAFHGFVRDEYTTLPETWDRVLSTDVDCTWAWTAWNDIDHVAKAATEGRFDDASSCARDITLRLFAEDDSASVQATMYKMGDAILAGVPEIQSVVYTLPNKHYFEIGTYKIFMSIHI